MIKRTALLFGLLAAAAAVPAVAHHSAAMFDNKKEVTITGTVVQLQWANPHVYLELDVPKAGGGVTPWSVEFPAGPAQLSRTGWKKNTVKPGDKVTVKVHPLRDARSGGDFVNIVLPDGSMLGRGAAPPAGGAAPAAEAPG